jgi:hypothetical protein
MFNLAKATNEAVAGFEPTYVVPVLTNLPIYEIVIVKNLEFRTLPNYTLAGFDLTTHSSSLLGDRR